jgi:hypothetical protein
MIALALGAVDVIHEDAAIWAAIGICLVTLAVEGWRYARLERVGPVGVVTAIAANVGLGLVIVVLKATLLH